MEPEAWREAVDGYMTWKGYPGLSPVDTVQVEDEESTWLVYYDLASGELEVEVAWRDDAWWFSAHLPKHRTAQPAPGA